MDDKDDDLPAHRALGVDGEEGEEGDLPEEDVVKIVHSYTLVKFTDMPEEVSGEVIDVFTTACEKFASNYEQAAKLVKETCDLKFGLGWHVIVGEGFGFEVSYMTDNLLYMYYGGYLGCVCWRCQ